MRKAMMILTLAVSWFAVSATLGAYPPPDCAPNCLMTR
jgi:hypothetical protein